MVGHQKVENVCSSAASEFLNLLAGYAKMTCVKLAFSHR
jgi:hypothetical protein